MTTSLDKISASNNEEAEISQSTEHTELKIDTTKSEVDEEMFNNFKKMVDDIKDHGWVYEKQYNDIMNRIVKPFEEKIKIILDKNRETKDISSMSDEELNNVANERMELQPDELEWQKELFKKITESGSSEEIEQLYEMVNNNMADIQSFWDEYINNAPKTRS